MKMKLPVHNRCVGLSRRQRRRCERCAFKLRMSVQAARYRALDAFECQIDILLGVRGGDTAFRAWLEEDALRHEGQVKVPPLGGITASFLAMVARCLFQAEIDLEQTTDAVDEGLLSMP